MRILRIPGSSYVDRVRENAREFGGPGQSKLEHKVQTGRGNARFFPFYPFTEDFERDDAVLELIADYHSISPYVIATFNIPRNSIEVRTTSASSCASVVIRGLEAEVTRSGTVSMVAYVVGGEILFTVPPETINMHPTYFTAGCNVSMSEFRVDFEIG